MSTSAERTFHYEQFSGDVYPPDKVTATGMFCVGIDETRARVPKEKARIIIDDAYGLRLESIEEGRARIASGDGVPVADAARAIRGHRGRLSPEERMDDYIDISRRADLIGHGRVAPGEHAYCLCCEKRVALVHVRAWPDMDLRTGECCWCGSTLAPETDTAKVVARWRGLTPPTLDADEILADDYIDISRRAAVRRVYLAWRPEQEVIESALSAAIIDMANAWGICIECEGDGVRRFALPQDESSEPPEYETVECECCDGLGFAR